MALCTLALLAGCSSQTAVETSMEQAIGNNADVQMNTDGTTQIQTDEGTYTTGQTLPADWPADAPTYANAQILYSASVNATTGQPGAMVMMMTTDTAETVMDFYKTSMASNGWTVSGTMEAGGSTVMTATKDTRAMSLAVSSADGQTSITIGIEQQGN